LDYKDFVAFYNRIFVNLFVFLSNSLKVKKNI